MLKRKAKEPRKRCQPCQAGQHAACDGPDDCDCSWCAQSRELAELAREESALLWPLDPEDPPYR